jgi:hypothetical protein
MGVTLRLIVIASSELLETQDTSQRFPNPAATNDCLKIVANSPDATHTQATFSGEPVVDNAGNVVGFDFTVPAHDEIQPNGVFVNVSFGGVLR